MISLTENTLYINDLAYFSSGHPGEVVQQIWCCCPDLLAKVSATAPTVPLLRPPALHREPNPVGTHSA